ncbi:hypothetical protein C5L14_06885 [Labrys okinawensis]|uniref:YcaO domain-containing protein n=1 Tax=Labrys okinawensis TaxID=346911 RepID=A0A2S9QHU4_9HYPH|nr:YcaO-like family protein [Labrys okinawensis]PRH88931.1 hypothetical protein C5L14_06885 [Labrys okinawensis]
MLKLDWELDSPQQAESTVLEEGAADPPQLPIPALLKAFGISRIGDLTELDVIGVPVWFAVRPNSRTLAVSQGKGLSHEQARISAIMESVESSVAEQTRELISAFGSIAEMRERGFFLVPLERIDRCRGNAFSLNVQRAWVPGIEYLTSRPTHAPYELIGLDLRTTFPWDHVSFHMSSTGLAAGPSFEFAALSALLEIIERDATALNELFGIRKVFAQPIQWQRNINQSLDVVMDRLHAANLDARLYKVVSKVGLPVVTATITRPVLDETGTGVRLSGGDACRMSVAEAALAALLEAIQSRLTNIAGSRDDMDAGQYRSVGSRLPALSKEAVALSDLSREDHRGAFRTARECLDAVVEKLADAGYPEIYLFDLPTNMSGVHVVRAIVPEMKTAARGGIIKCKLSDLGIF